MSLGAYGLAALALIAALFGAWLTVRKVGKLTVERDQAERAAEVKDAQLDKAARPPAGRAALLERMRRGDL